MNSLGEIEILQYSLDDLEILISKEESAVAERELKVERERHIQKITEAQKLGSGVLTSLQ